MNTAVDKQQATEGLQSNCFPAAKNSSDTKHLVFTLVIPALNEEEALASTLQQALASRCDVIEKTGIAEMNVVLVNDGSTDTTQQIADSFSEVIKVQFEDNRGYGAAIKAGFRATGANLLGFMDADGTCDPGFCVALIHALLSENADMAVGSRMNSQSAMPPLRRLGNIIFARLVGTVSGKKLTDCASGMRVLRRATLRQLHPLPDGLHFTPAMTCLALLHPRLKTVEVPMPYAKRMGRSKLRAIEDGFKFLFTILFTAALFNPIKSLATFGTLFFLLGLGICAVGAGFQASSTSLTVWCGAFAIVMFQAMFVGFVAHQTLHMFLGPRRLSGFGESFLQRYISTRRMVYAGIFVFAGGLCMFALSLLFSRPWNSVLALFGALAIVLAGWTALAGVILRVIWTANERRNAERDDPYGI